MKAAASLKCRNAPSDNLTITFFSFTKKLGTLAMGCLLLSACSHSRYQQAHDSLPHGHQSLARIANAIPKYEPLSRIGNPASYVVNNITYLPLKKAEGFSQTGIASWYGGKFQGHKTSNGEIYDPFAMTGAHKTLPLPSYVKVTNLKNHHWVIVRINDRGPFHPERIIDLSYAAAYKLGMLKHGTAKVQLEAITAHNLLPAVGEPYYIQAGAYSDMARANALLKVLLSQTQIPGKISKTNQNGRTLYRVWLGPLDNLKKAISVKKQLVKYNFINALLIKK